MYDEGCVIGRVVGREPGGPNSEFLIVEDRSKPKYPNIIAGELYGVNRALFEKVGLGDLCRMVGSIRSFRSKVTNKWYTTFNVFTVAALEEPVGRPIIKELAPAPPPRTAPVVRDRVPGEDDVTGDHPF